MNKYTHLNNVRSKRLDAYKKLYEIEHKLWLSPAPSWVPDGDAYSPEDFADGHALAKCKEAAQREIWQCEKIITDAVRVKADELKWFVKVNDMGRKLREYFEAFELLNEIVTPPERPPLGSK